MVHSRCLNRPLGPSSWSETVRDAQQYVIWCTVYNHVQQYVSLEEEKNLFQNIQTKSGNE